MRRSLAGVGRDVQNALERHIVASKAPRDLPHDGVADAGAENSARLRAYFHDDNTSIAPSTIVRICRSANHCANVNHALSLA